MLSSDKWADYFLISQARNCWERPWRLRDRRQRPNTCDLSLLLTFPSDHLASWLVCSQGGSNCFLRKTLFIKPNQTARPRGPGPNTEMNELCVNIITPKKLKLSTFKPIKINFNTRAGGRGGGQTRTTNLDKALQSTHIFLWTFSQFLEQSCWSFD